MSISFEIIKEIVCPMISILDVIKLSLTCSTLVKSQDEMINKVIEQHPFLKNHACFLTNVLKMEYYRLEFAQIIEIIEDKNKTKNMNLYFLKDVNQNKAQFQKSVKLYKIIQEYAKYLNRTDLYNSNISKFLASMKYMFKKCHPGLCNVSDAIFADAFLVKKIVSIENIDFDMFELYENISILMKNCPRSYTLYENVMNNDQKVAGTINDQIETIRILSKLHHVVSYPTVCRYLNYEIIKYLNRILYSCDVSNSTVFDNSRISRGFASTSYRKILQIKKDIEINGYIIFPKYLFDTTLAQIQIFEKYVQIYI